MMRLVWENRVDLRKVRKAPGGREGRFNNNTNSHSRRARLGGLEDCIASKGAQEVMAERMSEGKRSKSRRKRRFESKFRRNSNHTIPFQRGQHTVRGKSIQVRPVCRKRLLPKNSGEKESRVKPSIYIGEKKRPGKPETGNLRQKVQKIRRRKSASCREGRPIGKAQEVGNRKNNKLEEGA